MVSRCVKACAGYQLAFLRHNFVNVDVNFQHTFRVSCVISNQGPRRPLLL